MNERILQPMSKQTNRALWGVLSLLFVLAWAVVGVPAVHIQPFRPQTSLGMRWSYALRSASPLVTAAAMVTMIGVAVALWRRTTRRWARGGIVMLLVLGVVPTWFARQNHFEWMFAPLRDVRYADARDAPFVADADIVMGVEFGGVAAAYPIRQLGYHHIVNTEVGGRPIVATY